MRRLSYLFKTKFTSREVEEEYQRSLDKSRVQIVRIGIAIGTALNIMYTGWDSLVFSSALTEVTNPPDRYDSVPGSNLCDDVFCAPAPQR